MQERLIVVSYHWFKLLKWGEDRVKIERMHSISVYAIIWVKCTIFSL